MVQRGQYATIYAIVEEHGRCPKSIAEKFPSVVGLFASDENGYYLQDLEEARQKRARFLERQRANGMKGGRKKQTQTKPTASPSQTHGIKKDEKPEEFERFWEMYGRKGSKMVAKKKFLLLPEEVRRKIFAHVPSYVRSTPDPTYRKNAETYLNQQHWETEIQNGAKPVQKAAGYNPFG